MKIEITEKQLHLILSTQKSIDEQETTSTSQSGGGYPEVGKWTQNIERFPKKDIARGQGNKLK
jgi:hypothetical protein